jgi:hypothetical protein
MIVTEGRLCRVGTVHFDEEPPSPPGVDVVRYLQRRAPLPGAMCSPYHTRVIDLRQDTEALHAATAKDLRRNLRNGERNNLAYQSWKGDAAVVAEACDFYDRFAQSKGLPLADRAMIGAYRAQDRLYVSVVRAGDEPLVWHVYYSWRHRIVSLCSASFFRAHTDSAQRALLGAANRYHRWRDILMFKDAGFAVFDFGGWYEGTTDPERLRINRYKEDFGGTVERNWNCTRPVTLKGRLALLARQLPGATASLRERATRRFAGAAAEAS